MVTRTFALSLPLLLALVLDGCSSSSSSLGGAGGSSGAGASSTTSGASNLAGSPSADALFGDVVVALHAPLDDDGYSTAIGRFFAGPQPEVLALEPRLEDGDCTLFVPKAPFCSEPCTPAVCTDDEVCTDYPAPRSVGTLTLTGLGAALSLEPSSSKIVYQSPSLAYPPCEAGSPVTASASGLSLEAECIAPLELLGPNPIPVMAGAPVELSWKAAAAGAASRIRIKLDVSHHGGSKGEIGCEVADTGAFSIPAALVTELVGLGLAGFPTINLNRISVSTDPVNPRVSLVLASDVTRGVDTGVLSCLDHDDCPQGLCQDGGTCG